MGSETNKLPKWQRYPLKPSVLAEALTYVGTSVDKYFIKRPGNLFDAFSPPKSKEPVAGVVMRV